MSRIAGKRTNKQSKAINLKFNIDCSQPVDDKVLLLSDFADFLKQRIKVENKTGNLGDAVQVATEKSSIVVKANIPFSKRYLKYLTKKYLKKQTLRNYLYVTASAKDTYSLKYFNIQQDQE